MSALVTLYRHQIFCNTENAWAYLWKEDDVVLTTCPNDPAHTVQPNSASVIDTRDPNVVHVTKELTVATNGHFRVVSNSYAVPAGPGGTVSVSYTRPIDTSIYRLVVFVPAAAVGSTFKIEGAPLTLAGVLAAPVLTGATALTVTPAALPRVDPGFIVSFQVGLAVTEIGGIVTIDHTTGAITVDTPFPADFAAGTQVRITVRPIPALEIAAAGDIDLGAGLTSALGVPKNTTLVATFTNPTATPYTAVTHLHTMY